MAGTGELYLAQNDGSLPTALASGSAPGESGVSIFSMRFEQGAHFSATPEQHLVCFQMSQLPIECRMAGRSLWHEPPAGSLAVCPAGMDCAADTEQSADIVVVAIDPGQLALAAADDSALEVQLIERFSAYDPTLLDLANGLALESAKNYPSGALFWNELANRSCKGLSPVTHRLRSTMHGACWVGSCLRGSRTMCSPTSTSRLRLRRLPAWPGAARFISRAYSRNRSASRHTVTSFICGCSAPSNWFAADNPVLPTSPPAPGLPIRVTCRVGSGGFTASHSPNWRAAQRRQPACLHEAASTACLHC
jgi:hypothetical protein